MTAAARQKPGRKPGARRAPGADPALTRGIAQTVLGPILHRWLLALEQYVAYFDGPDTAFLYCARAGVRIRRLFDIHCAGRGVALSERHRMLWGSRVALCKGLFDRAPAQAAHLIAREYRDLPLRDAVCGLLRHAPERLAALDLSDEALDVAGRAFPEWIAGDTAAAAALRDSFARSGAAFDTLFEGIAGPAARVVLIDTGWKGSAQGLLARAMPERDVHGLYLGRILTDGHDPDIADRAIGLLFEAETYDPERPETALVLHRHLVESLLEPNGPSVEEVPGGPHDAVAQAQIAACAGETPSRLRDAMFLEVERYLKKHAAARPADIEAAAHAARPDLARLLVHPTRQEALALRGKDRSADFGKQLMVPVLVTAPDGRPEHADAHARIAHSLWPQGQAALEYDGGFAREVQRQLTGLTDGAAYFDPAVARPTAPAAPCRDAALVSVVTRTNNRPLLLRRAAERVAAQTSPDLEWIVVNDGGEEDLVRDVLQRSPVDRRRIRLISHTESAGMEAASNAGIAQASGRYLLIHDDDDTLHPDFLARSVAFLERPEGRRYGGVVTGTDYVSEEIRGDRVIEHSRAPYMDWVRNIQLAEMLAQNLFAPIAFLYRRSIYDRIGGYAEDLPVLGDWFFNLEFLLTADIAVLPERLARYHHRDHGDSSSFGLYANSLTGGRSKHLEFASVMRNMFMRKHGRSDPVAAAAISGYFASDMRARLDRIEGRLAEAAGDKAPGGADARTVEEVDRLWALTALLTQNARTGPRAAEALRRRSTLVELRAILRKTGLPLAPHPFFDEEAYLSAHPDVAEAVGNGQFGSGYQHFLLYGQQEGRARPLR